MFFLLYKYTDDAVFDDFPKISDHFPMISKDFPKLFRWSDQRSRTFFENFRNFPKITEDVLGRPEYVSMIHQLDVSEIVDIFTCEDIVSLL